MSRRPLEVKVSAEDQKQLRQLLRAGIQQVRVVLRALALEQLSAGLTPPRVAKMVHLTPQAVRRIVHRYKRGGLPGALYERQGRGAEQLLDEPQKQRIVAMVCSQPPERLCPLDRPSGRRTGRQTQTGAPSGPGDGADLIAQPRPRAVAGKKCGAWRS